ncbi:DUF1648 domain-containing protein [Cohnella endophytica]|uniref:DUF1648 domain-containing protein n=1 Tax=Cohnella endophytica TaxID=2419778 RepID=A0A494XDS0_9BACL|nr:DUF1648 domain-containing protein [Cohnella endophytica]RKP48022.1 DUF1648 domain-containing protein [Cohnella endophytica]
MNDSLTKRPKIEVPLTGGERALRLATLLLLIGTIVYLAVNWESLPSRIATHFNGKGEADGWGSKWTLWILPAISAVLYAGLTWLTRFPHVFNYPVAITELNAVKQYSLARQLVGWMNLEIVALFGYVVIAIVQMAKGGGGGGIGIGALPIILVVLFGTIGAYILRAIKAR